MGEMILLSAVGNPFPTEFRKEIRLNRTSGAFMQKLVDNGIININIAFKAPEIIGKLFMIANYNSWNKWTGR